MKLDYFVILKAGFMGFALSLGVQMLVFYLVGGVVRVTEKNFLRTFILAAVASFLAVDALLYYKISVSRTPDAPLFLSGCVGGWLGGIISGLTQMKPLLLKLRK